MARLDAPDLRGQCAVILTADHGEAFGEHGTYYHGHTLHEENIAVPLLVRVPGFYPGVVSGGVVSLVDLGPSVLRLARLPLAKTMRGREWISAMRSQRADPERWVYLESRFGGDGFSLARQSGVVGRDWKLIEDTASRTYRLYHLALDPGETVDVVHRAPDRAHILRRKLKTWQAEAAQ